jgi:Cu/Ag efflux protein CusF
MKRFHTTYAALGAIAVLAVLAAPVAAPAASHKKPITQKATTTIKSTIEAIDHDHRLVTLKAKDGTTETIYAPPEVRRFDELKVGDQVTFTYQESLVYHIRKPGEPVPPSTTDEPAVVRNATEKPSGSVTQQQTATVLVKAIDMKAPSVTVQTEDGRTESFHVEDKGNLKGLQPGDHVVIMYTEALLISVK